MLAALRLYILLVQSPKRSAGMKNVSISELRANLLKYLQEVQAGEPIEVTSKGVVMATLMPPLAEREAARAQLAELAETAVIHDVVAPIDAEWEAAQ